MGGTVVPPNGPRQEKGQSAYHPRADDHGQPSLDEAVQYLVKRVHQLADGRYGYAEAGDIGSTLAMRLVNKRAADAHSFQTTEEIDRFLTVSMRNVAKDQAGKAAANEATSATPAEQDALDDYVDTSLELAGDWDDMRAEVSVAFRAVDVVDRAVLLLVTEEHLSDTEVAWQLNISRREVPRRMYRARAALAAAMQAMGLGPLLAGRAMNPPRQSRAKRQRRMS